MWQVFFINFGYASQDIPTSFEQAKAIAKKAGFQSTIWIDETLVAAYCPLNGFTVRNRNLAI
jgi:hypothetical protein